MGGEPMQTDPDLLTLNHHMAEKEFSGVQMCQEHYEGQFWNCNSLQFN